MTTNNARRSGTGPRADLEGIARRGFTLIELGVVIAIIGILVAFILAAGSEGVRRAEERATQALIAKLDWGVQQRLDALLQTLPDTPNGAHQWLAAISPPGLAATQEPAYSWGLVEDPPTQDQRALAIANFDYVRSELPDVFLVNTNPGDDEYAFNFAGQPFPLNLSGDSAPAGTSTQDQYVLPLGHMGRAYRYNVELPTTPTPTKLRGPGDFDPSTTTAAIWRSNSKGIYGASYTARAGFNKLLGALPTGFDTIDNDGDTWIDEWDECVGTDAALATQMRTRLTAHTHKTARAETLYAILCEGIGPTGSYYSRDDFTNTQVGDTDGDGLPEFLDAWGEPLQFYRWPVHHTSDAQRGQGEYASMVEQREANSLDPNNTLMGIAWWSAQTNGGSSGSPLATPSTRAMLFWQHFTPLVDWNYPTYSSDSDEYYRLWDRSGATPRRAFYSRPLIVSSGPDRQLGIAQVGFNYGNYALPATASSVPAAPAALSANALVLVENTASSISPYRDLASAPYYPPTSASAGVTAGLSDPNEGWGLDDISSHNLRVGGGAQ